jgi:aryl-alcohol dehydrogenase-like predicted oxidoreductase
MKTHSIGKNGMQASALCLGCMYFGTSTDEETSFALLDAYVQAGGTFLDTANNYSFWANGGVGDESESLLGRWMRNRSNRSALTVATKVGARPKTHGAGWPIVEGLSANVIETAVEDSLRRLGIEMIDLYYAHIDDRRVPLEETLGAFEKLIKAGKVREIACSNMTTWRIAEAQAAASAAGMLAFAATQQRFSYLQPREGADFGIETALGGDFGIEFSVTPELLDRCRVRGDMAILAYSPLIGGAYAGKPLRQEYQSAENERRLVALQEVARQLGATPSQVALAWLMQVTPVTIPIIAASSLPQLSENLGAAQVKLGEEHLKMLGTL